VLYNLAWLVATLYMALIVLILGVFLPAALMFKVPYTQIHQGVREPAVIAFSTTPARRRCRARWRCWSGSAFQRRIVAFVLPLGYSFNLDGSTLYLSLPRCSWRRPRRRAVDRTARSRCCSTLMLTRQGRRRACRVPRLVILAGTLASYNLPLEGVTLILGVDAVMDMARTMTNVVGNCLATVVKARWEGEFKEASDEELDIAAARGEV
jgi:proton glutamate symport protein